MQQEFNVNDLVWSAPDEQYARIASEPRRRVHEANGDQPLPGAPPERRGGSSRGAGASGRWRLLTAEPGTIVRLNGGGLAHQRKLSAHGTSGIALAGTVLTAAEAAGTFEWLGDDGGREALVRSVVTGREGRLFRGLLRRV